MQNVSNKKVVTLRRIMVVMASVFSIVTYADRVEINELRRQINDMKENTTLSEETDIEPATQVLAKRSGVRYVEYDIPNYDTFFKAYMNYTAITNTGSPQYKLQQKAWTDDNGLRRIGDDYIIALGSYYTTHVGDRFRITLTTGKQFTATVGDLKNDAHTDVRHMYRAVYNENGKFISASVLEFITDTSELPRKVRLTGSVSGIDFFRGNIEKIEKIVEE